MVMPLYFAATAGRREIPGFFQFQYNSMSHMVKSEFALPTIPSGEIMCTGATGFLPLALQRNNPLDQ